MWSCPFFNRNHICYWLVKLNKSASCKIYIRILPMGQNKMTSKQTNSNESKTFEVATPVNSLV